MPPASRSRGRPAGTGRRPAAPAPAQRALARPAEPAAAGSAARRSSDLLARVLVAVPAAVVAIVFVDLGGTAWALFMLAITGSACTSSTGCCRAGARPRSSASPRPPAMVLAARFGTERDVLEIAMASIPVRSWPSWRARRRDADRLDRRTLLGICWLGLAFAHAVLLRRLDNGGGILIDILVGTFLGDTGAYIGGRLFGRRPLAPSISPKKTWEGLFCGMLIAILAVFIAGLNQTG